MSRPTFINSTVVYNDHSTEYNIDARGNKDIASVIRACNAEDVEPHQEAADKPCGNDILSIPQEGKYTQVRNYIKERCRFDEEFKTFCKERSLRDLCTRLTKEFGWFVDEHSLGANMNRNRYS